MRLRTVTTWNMDWLKPIVSFSADLPNIFCVFTGYHTTAKINHFDSEFAVKCQPYNLFDRTRDGLGSKSCWVQFHIVSSVSSVLWFLSQKNTSLTTRLILHCSDCAVLWTARLLVSWTSLGLSFVDSDSKNHFMDSWLSVWTVMHPCIFVDTSVG